MVMVMVMLMMMVTVMVMVMVMIHQCASHVTTFSTSVNSMTKMF
jgi:hypothetical protein